MESQQILKEIKSPALREIVESLVTVVNRVKDGHVSYQQANVEIVGHKHVIQSLALDWAFNKKAVGARKIKAIAG